jgi:hypothetical protein
MGVHCRRYDRSTLDVCRRYDRSTLDMCRRYDWSTLDVCRRYDWSPLDVYLPMSLSVSCGKNDFARFVASR